MNPPHRPQTTPPAPTTSTGEGYIHICIYTYIYVYTFTNKHTTYVYTCTCTCTYIYIYMYVYIYVCVYICVYIYYIYICVYIYILYLYMVPPQDLCFQWILRYLHPSHSSLDWSVSLSQVWTCFSEVRQVHLSGSKIQDVAGVLAQESWIRACWIQDYPRRFSGHLGSWILDPRKVFWRSWILDPNTTVLRFSSLNAQLRVGSPLFLYAHREDM